MEPIADWGTGVRTFKIMSGQNAHVISSCAIPATPNHFFVGAYFEVLLPRIHSDGSHGVDNEGFIFLLTEFTLFDVVTSNLRMRLGAYLRDEDGGITSWFPVKKAPYQITNYSTQTRRGSIEMNYKAYLDLFNRIKQQS